MTIIKKPKKLSKKAVRVLEADLEIKSSEVTNFVNAVASVDSRFASALISVANNVTDDNPYLRVKFYVDNLPF